MPYSYAGTMGLVQGEAMTQRFFHRLGASLLDRTICSMAGGEAVASVYGAKLGAARIARSLGEMPRAIALVEAAQALQARFNTAYWCDDIETFALALDGDKQACRVRTSNPGHCLFSGIAHAERARARISQYAAITVCK